MRTGLNSPASSSARDPNLRVDSVAGSSRSDVAEELGPDVCIAVLDRAHMRDACGSQLTRFIAARFQLGFDIPAFELPRGRCRPGLVVGEPDARQEDSHSREAFDEITKEGDEVVPTYAPIR